MTSTIVYLALSLIWNRLLIRLRTSNQLKKAAGHQYVIDVYQNEHVFTIDHLDLDAWVKIRHMETDDAYKLVEGRILYARSLLEAVDHLQFTNYKYLKSSSISTPSNTAQFTLSFIAPKRKAFTTSNRSKEQSKYLVIVITMRRART